MSNPAIRLGLPRIPLHVSRDRSPESWISPLVPPAVIPNFTPSNRNVEKLLNDHNFEAPFRSVEDCVQLRHASRIADHGFLTPMLFHSTT